MRKPAWTNRSTINRYTIARFGIGVACMLGITLGTIWAAQTAFFLNEASSATGTATKIEQEWESRGGTRPRARNVTYATIEFTASDGQQISFEQELSYGIPVRSVGDNVQILYLEDDPTKTRVDSFLGIWRTPLTVTGSSIIVAALIGLPAILRSKA